MRKWIYNGSKMCLLHCRQACCWTLICQPWDLRDLLILLNAGLLELPLYFGAPDFGFDTWYFDTVWRPWPANQTAMWPLDLINKNAHNTQTSDTKLLSILSKSWTFVSTEKESWSWWLVAHSNSRSPSTTLLRLSKSLRMSLLHSARPLLPSKIEEPSNF